MVLLLGSRVPALGLVLVLTGVVLTGALTDPTPEGFITFDEIRRTHFTALAVHHQSGEAQDGPLIVRVNVIGDAADWNWSKSRTWLNDTLNVRLERDPDGVPLYLTRDVLMATSGPATLGATVKSGMAVEVRQEAVANCIIAHETLHFLGLGHDTSPTNLMYPRCSAGKPGDATLSPAQMAHIEGLQRIRAVMPGGITTWASR